MELMEKASASESPLRQGTRTCRDGILWRQKLAAAEMYFRGPLPWFQIFWGFIGGRCRAKEPRGAHKPARGLVTSPGVICLGSHVPCVSSVIEKFIPRVLFRLDSV